MTAPVEVTRLGRRFGRRDALLDVSFDVLPGEIVGLVGPNGSGKTTLLKALAGLLRPTSGAVRVFGADPARSRADIMERARFAFAPPPLFEGLTAREHLVHLGRLHRGQPPVPPGEIDRVLDDVGLRARAGDPVRTFSFGMKQRLALAQALLPRPELLVLDEPTDGLDPMAILELREVLRRLNEAHGVAILLSSHLLVEVDELVDRMLVLREGRALFLGEPRELYEGSRRVRLQADPLDLAAAALSARGHAVEREADALFLPPGSLDLAEADAILRGGGARLLSFHEHRPSLERALLARLQDAGDLTGAEERAR